MAKFCAHCGAPLPNGSGFCNQCGAPVQQLQQQPQQGSYSQPAYPQYPAPRKKKVWPLVLGASAAVTGALGIVAAFFLVRPSPTDAVPISSIAEETAPPAESAAAAPVVPGQDPQFSCLRGLDMTFDQLADEGYFPGEKLESNQLYTFNRFGDQAQFVMAADNLTGESQPVSLRATLSQVFPELDGLSSKEAEELFFPYLTITYTTGNSAQGTYETDHYICTIYPDTSGTLRESDIVEIRRKDAPETSASPAPEAAAQPAAAPEESEESNYYILPQSSQRLLTYVDIANFTKQDMMLARNEIFARHGRKFSDEDVRTYFEAQSWYKGTIEPGDFSMSAISDIEQKNIDFLKQYEDGLNGVSQQVGNAGSVTTYNGYMIPQSSARRLTYADISGLSKWQLSIARNEIYARNGRLFIDPDVQAYFNAQSWYYGYIPAESFDGSALSDTEKYNIEFIKSYE